MSAETKCPEVVHGDVQQYDKEEIKDFTVSQPVLKLIGSEIVGSIKKEKTTELEK
ncbi:hypothetical protein DPMN_135566 [Dreissena polymorpha]|uniref:Uncharacterized protein n=1 Tax=Dreissena polymorpha TaxID=45954 RepID=A0A9D4JBU5_DREPO|nr:hypothetical protein DPMN_135566 [Dreissena polymorpha]